MPKRKTRKGQVHTEVFTYILSIILASLLLLYGYNAIKNFQAQEKFVELLKFKIDLKNYVQAIKSNYGDADLKTVIVPDGFNKICFVDTRKSYTFEMLDQFIDPIIYDSVRSKAKQNVFMVDNNLGISKHAFYVGNISIESPTPGDDFVCLGVQGGVIKVKLEGMGSHVKVSGW